MQHPLQTYKFDVFLEHEKHASHDVNTIQIKYVASLTSIYMLVGLTYHKW